MTEDEGNDANVKLKLSYPAPILLGVFGHRAWSLDGRILPFV